MHSLKYQSNTTPFSIPKIDDPNTDLVINDLNNSLKALFFFY